MEIVPVRVGSWEINFAQGRPYRMDPAWVRAQEAFLNEQWIHGVRRVPYEYPWGGLTQLGRPSPLVRIDFFPTGDPREIASRVAEVEIRPGGLGATLQMASMVGDDSPLERARLAFDGVNGFVQFGDNPMQDDPVLAGHLGLPFLRGEEGIPDFMASVASDGATPSLWVRSEKMGPHLEPYSVVPVRADGDKRDLLYLGLAVPTDPTSFDYSQAVVLKPLFGKWCRGLRIWLPSGHSIYSLGDTRKKVDELLAEIATAPLPYMNQPFQMPLVDIRSGDSRQWFGVARCYFGWIRGEYRWIAGNVFWRRNTLRLHGAKDAEVSWILVK